MLSSSSGSLSLRGRPSGLSPSAGAAGASPDGAVQASALAAASGVPHSFEGAVSPAQSLVAPSTAASTSASTSFLSSVLASAPPQDCWIFLSESLGAGWVSRQQGIQMGG